MKALAPQPKPPLPKATAAPLTPVLVETPPVEEVDEKKAKQSDSGMVESLAERVLRPAQPKASVNTGYADLVGAARNQPIASNPDVGASSGVAKGSGSSSSSGHHQTLTRVVRSAVHAEPTQSLQFKLATELVRDEDEDEDRDDERESAVQRKGEPSLAGDAPVPPDDEEARLQRKSTDEDAPTTATSPTEMQAVACAGVEGASEPLPHLDRIQPLLAPHDLSGVRTVTGGAAAEANARLGALGYTMGERIAFRSAPDVKLAAHEAAHVVQQRQGVDLVGGLGRADDSYERLADEVSEAALSPQTGRLATANGLRGQSCSGDKIQRQQAASPPPSQALGGIAAQYPDLAALLSPEALQRLEGFTAPGTPDTGVLAPSGMGDSVDVPLLPLLSQEAAFVDQDIWETLFGVLRAGGGDQLCAEILRNEIMRRYLQRVKINPATDSVSVTVSRRAGSTPGALYVEFTLQGTKVSTTRGLIAAADLAQAFPGLEAVIAEVATDGGKVALGAAIVDALERANQDVNRLAAADPKDQRLSELRAMVTAVQRDRVQVDDFIARPGPVPSAAKDVSGQYDDLLKRAQATLDSATAWHESNGPGKSLGEYNEQAGTWLAGQGLSEWDKGGAHYVTGALAFAGAFVVAFVEAGEEVFTFGYHDTATAVSKAWQSGDITWNEGDEIMRSAFRRTLLIAALTRGLGGATARLGAGFAGGLGLVPESTLFGVTAGGIAGTLTSAGALASQTLLAKEAAGKYSTGSVANQINNAAVPTARAWAMGLVGGGVFGTLGGVRIVQSGNAARIGQVEMTPEGPMRVAKITGRGDIVYSPIAPVAPTRYGPMRVVLVLPDGLEVLEPANPLQLPPGPPSSAGSLVEVPRGYRPSASLGGRTPVTSGGPIVISPNGQVMPSEAQGEIVSSGLVQTGEMSGDLASRPTTGELAPGAAPAPTSQDLVSSYLRMIKSGGPEAPEALVSTFGVLQSGGVSAATGPLEPTIYNPSGLTTNCGFCAISRALYVLSERQGFANADQLYAQTLRGLGLPIDTPTDPLSRMLVFPAPTYEGFRPRPGYEALFNDEGNRLGEYSITSVAQSSGLSVQSTSGGLGQWALAFHPQGVDAAVAQRLEQMGIDPLAVADDPEIARRAQGIRANIVAARSSLPGEYIIGSSGQKHFMNLTIAQDGKITGLDPQTGEVYADLAAIERRMGVRIDVMLRVSSKGVPGTGNQK